MFDFNEAIVSHIAWRVRVKSFLDGGKDINLGEAMSYKSCSLGKWLYSAAMLPHANTPGVQELKKIHIELHIMVRLIVEIQKSGNKDGAREKYDEFLITCDKFTEIIRDLKKKL